MTDGAKGHRRSYAAVTSPPWLLDVGGVGRFRQGGGVYVWMQKNNSEIYFFFLRDTLNNVIII